MEQVIKQVLEQFRPGFQADGADIHLNKIDNETIYLKLIISSETCLDCILPKTRIEPIFSRAFSGQLGRPLKVCLEDPREV